MKVSHFQTAQKIVVSPNLGSLMETERKKRKMQMDEINNIGDVSWNLATLILQKLATSLTQIWSASDCSKGKKVEITLQIQPVQKREKTGENSSA